MPRDRLLAQIDEELVHAHASLKFWRDQALLLDRSEYQSVAQRQVPHREALIEQLLEAHEMLLDGGKSNPARASAPLERPTASR